jgi:hypothetical protein
MTLELWLSDVDETVPVEVTAYYTPTDRRVGMDEGLSIESVERDGEEIDLTNAQLDALHQAAWRWLDDDRNSRAEHRAEDEMEDHRGY